MLDAVKRLKIMTFRNLLSVDHVVGREDIIGLYEKYLDREVDLKFIKDRGYDIARFER